jgi:hypothetical protein
MWSRGPLGPSSYLASTSEAIRIVSVAAIRSRNFVSSDRRNTSADDPSPDRNDPRG